MIHRFDFSYFQASAIWMNNGFEPIAILNQFNKCFIYKYFYLLFGYVFETEA